MPHLSGIFEEFPDLDKVSPLQIETWLKNKPEIHALANFLGNRLLYPQTVALSQSEMEIDLAILREAIKQKPALIADFQRSKLFIPQDYLYRFPPLPRLVGALIEAINPKGVYQIHIKNQNQLKLVGSLISPPDIEKLSQGKKEICVDVGGFASKLRVNTVSISRIEASEVKVIIGGNEYKVNGGELGVIIDLRVVGPK